MGALCVRKMGVRSGVVALIFATCVFTYAQGEGYLADSIVDEMAADEIEPLFDEELVQMEDQAACANVAPDANCAKWKKAGQCKTLPMYMEKNCAKECGLCGVTAAKVTTKAVGSAATTTVKTDTGCTNTEETYECRGWAAEGECKTNAAYMKKHCAKACGFCGSFKEGDVSKFRAMELRCEDVHTVSDCETWAQDGQCKSNEGFMKIMCKKSCGLCETTVRTVVQTVPPPAPIVPPPAPVVTTQHYVYGGLVNGSTESTVAPVMRKQSYVKYVPVHKTVVEYHNITESHVEPITTKVVTHKEIPETETKVVPIPIKYSTRTVYKTRYTPQLHYKLKDTYEPIVYNKTEHFPEPEIKYINKSMDVPTLTYVTKTKSIPVVNVKTVQKNITVMEKVPVIHYVLKPVQKTISMKVDTVSYVSKNYSVPVLGTKTVVKRVPIELHKTLTKVVRKEVEKPVYRKVVEKIPVVSYKNVTTAHVIRTPHATKVVSYTKMVPQNQVHNVVRYKTVQTQHVVKQQIPETARKKEVYTRYVVDEKATAERAVKVAQRQAKQTSQVVSSGMSKWTKEGPGRVVQVGTPHVVSQTWANGDDDGVVDDDGSVVTDGDVVVTNTTMDMD